MNDSKFATQMIQEIELEIERMSRTLERLKTRVSQDDLTGLLRRDEFFFRLESNIRHGGKYAVIMIDIDNFKQINDQDGHIVGDHILQRVAAVLKRCERIGAEVGRYGGEEFVVAVPASRDSARVLGEAIRRKIQREVNVTVSVGVATTVNVQQDLRWLVGQADHALYQAKHTGKNRVCLAA